MSEQITYKPGATVDSSSLVVSVLWPGPDGLVWVREQPITILTPQPVSRDEWLELAKRYLEK